MRFGVSTSIDQADHAKRYGWDFIELNVQQVFDGLRPDEQWVRPTPALETPAANCLVPGSMRVVGPDVDLEALRTYMARVVYRAVFLECRTLVFGSGAARAVPAGFDPQRARQQLVAFLRMAGGIAGEYGVRLVVEPLHRGETNTLNTLGDALDLVREVAHPHVRQLLDTYHFWTERDALAAVADAGALIEHVHVADRDGRLAPGESNTSQPGGASDYRAIFAALKANGYDGRVSVECNGWDWAKHAERVLTFLRREWAAA